MADEAGTPQPPPPEDPQAAAAPPVPPVDSFKERKWLPTILVFLITSGITLGGYFVAAALEDIDEQASVVVGPLTIHPPDGWEVVQQLTSPVEGVQLTNGAGYANVFFGSFQGDSAGLYQEYMTLLAASASEGRDVEQFRYRLEPEPFSGPSGIQGARGFYIGSFEGLSAPIEGEVFAFVDAAGAGIVFDGYAAEGQYPAVADDIRELVSDWELTA